MSKAVEQILKEFGKGSVSGASFLLERPKKIISLSPTLDLILSGGIPEGTIVQSSGKYKVGKTTKALSFARNYQIACPESRVYYFDIEDRLKRMNLEGIAGLDLSEERFMRVAPVPSTDKKPAKVFAAEDYLKMAKWLLESEKCLIIFDSVSALCTKDELAMDPSGSIRPMGPKLLSHFLKQNAALVHLNNSIFWSIHHLIDNTSGYGEAQKEDGGNKMQYWQDIKLRAKGCKKWESGGNQIGLNVTWECKNSALGRPNQSIESFIRFNYGIDREEEVIELASSLDIVKRAGAWFEYNGNRIQGRENFNTFLKENPEVQAELEGLIHEAFYGSSSSNRPNGKNAQVDD